MNYTHVKRFHGSTDRSFAREQTSVPEIGISEGPDLARVNILERSLRYRFYSHFHPYPDELIKRLIKGSVMGLQDADTDYSEEALPQSTRVKMPDDRIVTLPDDIEISLAGGGPVTLPSSDLMSFPEGTEVELLEEVTTAFLDGSSETYPSGTRATLIGVKPKPKLYEKLFTTERYQPSDLVAEPHPVKDLDFTPGGAYAVYNWELFYHVPLTIAIHLSKNQRFEEAMSWFHYVFDPTDDSDGPTPERFWKVRPFQYTDVKMIEELLVNLVTGTDSDLQFTTVESIDAWMNAPFRPHLVARYRQTPYMFKAVMAYLDNLIAWGDSLFREDSRESINEATQLYVLAANILGVRPQAVPKKGTIRPQTYDNLKRDLRAFGTVLREAEDIPPFDHGPFPGDAADINRYNTLRSIGSALYFCVPRNDKLLGYWDTVADRLFKIRNSLNIQGIFRQLPLFEPPIDPALLAKAAAAGLDVGAIISGINQPLPLVRFQFLIQKAAEICQEVKSLGNNLLAAIEKEDNEAIALLRAKHEAGILRTTEMVKYQQRQEALKTLEGLDKSLDNAVQRYKFYERLLGKADSELEIIDPESLDIKENLRPIEVDIEAVDAEDESLTGGAILSSHEVNELKKLKAAEAQRASAATMDIIASGLSLIPQFHIVTAPVGMGADTDFGGKQISTMMAMIASAQRIGADMLTYDASHSAKIGSYKRREQEWAYQSNLTAGEIVQIHKQIEAAQIRALITDLEWQNHQTQIKYAEEIEQFLSGEETPLGDNRHKKTSTHGFYAWMKREAKGLYGQVFQFAFDIAKKAERALQHELADPGLSFLQFGYLAGKEGLLAGEKLYLDIKRMEMAHHDQNRREYELTKHVSLLQVDPLALMQLRTTGNCTVALPESIFDMDCPGHYFRRIKSVALSIPCVTGPYSSVNCTLTLQKSSIRKNAQLNGSNGYERTGSEDPRFSDHFGSLQSIVTSSSQNDSGMFETNLRDERYLPFENSGIISEWRLELPANPSNPDHPLQFDYDTISDVLIHLRYTAREGGNPLRNAALGNLSGLIDRAEATGSVRLFSLRQEFPTEWASFKGAEIDAETEFAPLTIGLRAEHYPFWSQDRLGAIRWAEVLAKSNEDVVIAHDATGESAYGLGGTPGSLQTGRLNEPPASPIGEYALYLNTTNIEDLWLVLAWGAEGGE